MAPLTALVPQVRPALTLLYQSPARHYHNLAHIQSCLALFHTHRAAFQRPDAAELALWFHDAIYDPRKHDNEERSVALARETLGPLGTPADDLHAIETLILSTRHAAPPPTPDAALVVDIDLAILAADAPAFDAYELAIRREYAHVPTEAFNPARAKILQSFLARPAIYHTGTFRPLFEQNARANLARSQARLAAQ